jgi:hypothetical protein
MLNQTAHVVIVVLWMILSIMATCFDLKLIVPLFNVKLESA